MKNLKNRMKHVLIRCSSFTFKLIFSFSLFTFHLINAQELQTYIEEAQANNPQIQGYELRYNLAQEKVNEFNTLPNTTVSAGYFISEPETRTGAQKARFSVSQMLPWFGTITARESYASSMAEAEFVEIAIAKRKLSLTVAQSYYQLYAIEAKQKILDENIALLQTYEQLALTSVEVGKASAVDVLKLQIRQNELRQQKAILQEAFLGEQSVFNNLLNKDEFNSIVVAESLNIPNEDPVVASQDLTLNPELIKYDKLYESVENSEYLNQKENAPAIGFGMDYVPVAKRTDMAMSDNGKDIFMPMVTLSIPIFNNRFTSVSKQNKLQQQVIRSQQSDRLNNLETALAKAKSERNQARIAFETQEKNLKQAKDAEEILTKNYETGTIDFNDLLDIQELQLKFQMDMINAITNYYKQSAMINYLIN